ncbi:hypothetical protein OG321_37040 [Streptomyces sp. NBC_00424]|uniref:hypothetical protein n=1 Tax=Streptomyces sp. NBC_00424 TaxID=2903648 RepID=UPI00224F8D79|nr:hypothetical protein [Streptomyces sp. NBC_00424]MCX5078058.1 hypothetical protein [Streptomyces sp. NBC_00424]
MDTDQTPPGTPTSDRPRGLNGCAVAVVVLTGLVILAAWALAEFEKGFDGYGQLEQSGPSGYVADPLGPGATARYEDGLKVTVSRPRPEPDGSYSLTVTYENDTDEELRPGGESSDAGASEYGPAPLVVRAGKSLDDHASGYSVTWLNRREAAAALVPPLGTEKKRTVPVRVKPSVKGIPVTVEVDPPTAGFRETAYFQFSLD